MNAPLAAGWNETACILCALNSGLEAQTEGGRIVKARGDKDHPTSQGYACEKSLHMDFYQNGADRITSPTRRRAEQQAATRSPARLGTSTCLSRSCAWAPRSRPPDDARRDPGLHPLSVTQSGVTQPKKASP